VSAAGLEQSHDVSPLWLSNRSGPISGSRSHPLWRNMAGTIWNLGGRSTSRGLFVQPHVSRTDHSRPHSIRGHAVGHEHEFHRNMAGCRTTAFLRVSAHDGQRTGSDTDRDSVHAYFRQRVERYRSIRTTVGMAKGRAWPVASRIARTNGRSRDSVSVLWERRKGASGGKD